MYLWGSIDDSPQAVSHLSRDVQKLGSGLLCDATGFYRPRGYVQNMSEAGGALPVVAFSHEQNWNRLSPVEVCSVFIFYLKLNL